jgi:hypothetical protein
MTGHIRRRGEHSWELKFDTGTDPLTGRRRIRYASFKGTKRRAEIELVRLMAEHAAVDPTKATVGEFLSTRLTDWAKQNVSPLTFQRYESLVRLYVCPALATCRSRSFARSTYKAFTQAYSATEVSVVVRESRSRARSDLGDHCDQSSQGREASTGPA